MSFNGKNASHFSVAVPNNTAIAVDNIRAADAAVNTRKGG